MISRKYSLIIINFVVVLIIVCTSAIPVFWLLSGAFKTVVQFWAYPPKIIPRDVTLENFKNILIGMDSRLPYLFNSLVISFFTTVFTLLLAIPAAYGFSRFHIKGSKHLEFWILSTRMMPPIAALIPLFLIIKKINLFDTRLSMVLIYIAFNIPYAVWMLTIFFRKLPKAIEESASLDGCSSFMILRKIVFPLSKTSIFTVGIFVFIFSWNELLYALILTGNTAKTLPVAISEYAGGIYFRWELLTAASVLQVVPAILVIVFLQKFIVSGLTLGAIDK